MRRSLSLLVLLSLLSLPAFSNTITVNGFTDALSNSDGVCTIREAVLNANFNNGAWTDCAAGSGHDVVNLPAGTITFSIAGTQEDAGLLADLDVWDSVTVNGNAAGTTIDVNGKERAFDFNPTTFPTPGTGAPITASLNDIYITNGFVFGGDGGGMQVQPNATVTATNITISNCETNNDGGGVMNNGTLTMINCTVTGNVCPWLGGGVANNGFLTLKSCTITNNSQYGAGPPHAQGVRASGPTTIQNTIIAGNGTGAPDFEPEYEGTLTSLGHNVIGPNGVPPHVPATGDQVDITTAQVNLAPLANNGGPVPTHAPNAGSVAIDQGNSDGLTTDERGSLRPCDDPMIANATGGDGADVGAFEILGTCAAPNDPPVAVADSYDMDQDTTLNVGAPGVLGNDSDPNGDSLTATLVSDVSNGTLVLNADGSFTYEPDPGFVGDDTFTYYASDGTDDSNTVTVTVHVADTQEPVITISLAKDSLWPPNHNLIQVGLSYSTSDNGGGTVTSSVAVYSDEDDLAPESGNHSPDAKDALRLRAERSGTGDGRVYLIVITATDASSNTSHACATVVVPKSMSAADVSAVNAQAAAAVSQCGTIPAGYFVVGDGPVVGPKQ
jgi:VCBS repeat-containing protein